jgi:hypothetical protein
LFAAYEEALIQATAAAIPWILLLDQDTHFFPAFLCELLSTIQETDKGVAAIVPHLQCNDVAISPAKVRFGRSSRPIPELSGIPGFRVTALNSGAAFRSSFLRSIGGFDPRFWLDAMDFWLFYEVHRRAFRVHILVSVLEHGLSAFDLDRLMATDRYVNAKNAESLFVDLCKGPVERFAYSVSLLRQYIHQRMTFANQQIAEATLKVLKKRCVSRRRSRIAVFDFEQRISRR